MGIQSSVALFFFFPLKKVFILAKSFKYIYRVLSKLENSKGFCVFVYKVLYFPKRLQISFITWLIEWYIFFSYVLTKI